MKHVASTLKSIPTSEVFKKIVDPTDDCVDIVADMKAHWAYDLYTRRPGPALLEDGVLKPTDLDLACFLAALVDRKAVINLPVYRSRRGATVRKGEHVVSKDNRHGHVLGLVANMGVFSFSVRMQDMNVMVTNDDGKDTVGAYRNFMVVDLDGQWYDGWKKIEFLPSRKENDFLTDRKLWTGNEIVFENFVHPNRWTSFYGQWYLLTKLLVQRLRAEVKFRNKEMKEKLAAGISFPVVGEGAPRQWPETERVGNVETKEVTAFEAEVDAPIPETFRVYSNDQTGLIAAKKRQVLLQYTDVPTLNFAVRATELAFFNMICDVRTGFGGEPFPSWISGARWEDHKIKRTSWKRLVLHQQFPFEKGLALRYRVYKKSEQVAIES